MFYGVFKLKLADLLHSSLDNGLGLVADGDAVILVEVALVAEKVHSVGEAVHKSVSDHSITHIKDVVEVNSRSLEIALSYSLVHLLSVYGSAAEHTVEVLGDSHHIRIIE